MFKGHGFIVLERKYWLCKVNSKDAILNDDTLALIKEIDNSWSTLSSKRVGCECIGPYAVLIFDSTTPDTIGFLATITHILAKERIPILAYSSYDRDYILVPQVMVEKAIKALIGYGFILRESSVGDSKI